MATTPLAFAEDALTRTRQLPNGDRIAAAGYILGGFGIHRDSDPLDESNFYVALRLIAEACGLEATDVTYLGRPWEDGEPCTAPVGIVRFRHWAVGWIEELVVRIDHAAAITAAIALLDRLENYPILDEDHYAELEAANADYSEDE